MSVSQKMAKNQDNNFRSSEVERTFTAACDWSSLSFDQRGQLNASATARYSTSLRSGLIFSAFSFQASYSRAGGMSIREKISSDAAHNSFSDAFDFLMISGKCLSSSFSINSGEINCNRGEKSRLLVIPEGESKAAMTMFASTTSSMEHQTPYAFTCRSWMPFLTFLPSSTLNLMASSSVNFDFAAMALRMRNWVTRCRIASWATAGQSKMCNLFRSLFKSSGTVSVKVAMPSEKASHFFKPFAAFRTWAA